MPPAHHHCQITSQKSTLLASRSMGADPLIPPKCSGGMWKITNRSQPQLEEWFIVFHTEIAELFHEHNLKTMCPAGEMESMMHP
eukprot:10725124-Ditylum_brightwellii.AAC.1